MDESGDLATTPPTPRSTPCECTAPGFCPRHQLNKVGRLFELCQTRPEYWESWETGHGRPSTPQANPFGEEYPCIHRGPVKRGEKCKSCGNREVTAQIHWCGRHGECTVHSHGLTGRPEQPRPRVCAACEERQTPPERIPLVIEDRLCLGDITVLAAACRELALQYPGRYRILTRTNHPHLFEGSPWAEAWADDIPLPDGAVRIQARYDAEKAHSRPSVAATVNRSNEHPHHFLEAYCEGLATALNLPPLRPRHWLEPAILLTEEERGWIHQVHDDVGAAPFWLINAGTKRDYTTKLWPGYQELVDQTAGEINWVQVGRAEDDHPPLRNVINLVGRTDGRQLVRLVYHAAGTVSGLTGLAHLAHWVDTSPAPWGWRRRHAVVIAGGREPSHWFAYPGQQVFHTLGLLDCCRDGGCWRSRVFPLPDQSEHNNSICSHPDEGFPRCMQLIDPYRVSQAVLLAHRSWLAEELQHWQQKEGAPPARTTPPALPTP